VGRDGVPPAPVSGRARRPVDSSDRQTTATPNDTALIGLAKCHRELDLLEPDSADCSDGGTSRFRRPMRPHVIRAGRAEAASRSQSAPDVSGAARSGRSWRDRRPPTSGHRPPESRRRSVFRPPRCRRRQLDLLAQHQAHMPVLSMPSRPSPSRRQPGQVVASSVPSPRSRTERSEMIKQAHPRGGSSVPQWADRPMR
jgi:hypothetical protein